MYTFFKYIYCINHRREHARNKQELESLIAEVDRVAHDVDPSVLLTKKKRHQVRYSPTILELKRQRMSQLDIFVYILDILR